MCTVGSCVRCLQTQQPAFEAERHSHIIAIILLPLIPAQLANGFGRDVHHQEVAANVSTDIEAL